jgi:uncharacterized protein involved in exopolysaccharide biosynthesis/Mrp family chromosome partitioning ATPase
MKSEMMVAETDDQDISELAVGETRPVGRSVPSVEGVEATGALSHGGSLHTTQADRSRWVSLDLTRYLAPLFIYQRIVWQTMILAGLACWIALLVWPRTFVSEGKLQLLVGRESVGLDPSSTTTQTLLMQKTVEEDINSALEILGSRDVAQHVMSEIGAEPILSGFLPNSDGENSRIGRWIGGLKSLASDVVQSIVTATGIRDPISDEERAVLWLQEHVSVHAPKKSSTMIISAEAKSAEMAHAIVTSYTKHFIERHVNVATTEGSRKFFDEQATNAETALNMLMSQRSELLRKHKMVSAGSRFGSLTGQQATIESTIISTEAQIRQSESELIDLTERIDELEMETVSGKQIAPDGTISGMRMSLHSLELEEQSLAQRYAADHWKLLQIKDRAEMAREALAKLEQESESLSTAPNPLRLKLEEDILRTKSRIVGLQSLLEESQIQLATKQQEINDLLELEVQLDRLDREIDVAKKNLSLLREKQEQARVVEDLRLNRISSVGIAQSATLVHKPASPNKMLIIAAFVALGGGICVALIGMKEFSRKAFRYADELERFAGYPVLAEVPQVKELVNNKLHHQEVMSKRYLGVRSACEIVQSEILLSDNNELERTTTGLKLAVVGIHDGAGASLIAMTLAKLHSESSFSKTMIVDLDRKNATLAQAFGAGKDGCLIRLFPASSTGTPVTASPAELPNSGRASEGVLVTADRVRNEQTALHSLQTAATESQFVVVDFPPMSRPAATLNVLSQVDGVLLVVQAEQSATEAVARAIRQIERAGGKIVGLVLNRTQLPVPSWIRKLLG